MGILKRSMGSEDHNGLSHNPQMSAYP